MATLDFEQYASSNSMNFEELFNMELFAASQLESTNSPSLSRAGSNSPSTSFFSLPPATPPTVLPPESFNTAIDTAMFDFGLPETDFAKPAPLPMNVVGLGLGLEHSPSTSSTSPASAAPYDFFASFSGAETPETPLINDANTDSSLSPPKPVFAIDPSLVGVTASLTETRSQSQVPSLPPIDEEDDSDESDADLEMEEAITQPVKVGGKGKARRGTVASGGVSKRSVSGASTTAKEKAADMAQSSAEVDWRPSPEEYKKMSSKEKRQLRNKISARNFRVRRKGI